jgi:hypothetical protein
MPGLSQYGCNVVKTYPITRFTGSHMTLIQFFSAFGLGALITALVQAWLTRHAEDAKRNFQEKKDAYVGLLDALHRSETDQTEEASRFVGLWMDRIELVGSKGVIVVCRRLTQTNPVGGHTHPDRPDVLFRLKEAMRRDLGVAS